MKSFLNETINSQNSVIAADKHKIEEYTKIFNQTVNNVYSLLGENCFRRYVKIRMIILAVGILKGSMCLCMIF